MDLLELEGQQLYFDEPMPQAATELIAQASLAYGSGAEEALLLKASFIAPNNLSVLVALYRCYFYQHCLEDAQRVARRALRLVAERVGFPDDWRRLNQSELANAVYKSMGLVRFYMSVLKADGYLLLRRGEIAEGRARLEKVAELDSRDQFGARALLEMLAGSEIAKELEAAPVTADIHNQTC